jgi:hypothetical protein
MFSHFQGREMAVERRDVERHHDEFWVEFDVFIDGKVSIFTDFNSEAPLSEHFTQTHNGHLIVVNDQDRWCLI